MARETIETLTTLRIVPKSKNTYNDILAIEFELYHELSPMQRDKSRQDSFGYHHYHAQREEQRHDTEYRLFFPGPKLWTRISPIIYDITKEEHNQLEKVAEDQEFVEFSVQRNGGLEEYVPLLFDNVRLTLDKLGIREMQHSTMSKSIKKRKFFQQKGGYDAARIELLHPELREKTLRESILTSYRDVKGVLPEKVGLYALLKDYSEIISHNVSQS